MNYLSESESSQERELRLLHTLLYLVAYLVVLGDLLIFSIKLNSLWHLFDSLLSSP